MADALPLLQGCVFLTLLCTASVTDVRRRIIPNRICAAIALCGLIDFSPVRLPGIFCALPLLVAALTCGGLGGGDVKLMAAAGLTLGFSGGVIALAIGLSMLLFYLCLKLCNKARHRECPRAFPMAPFLTIGCITAFILTRIGGIM